MADSQDVWGVEIGQAGLKAIQLRYAESADQVLAMGFDYVPHPKILSQPDAVPEELIPEALETFIERNDVRGCRLAISVPGPTSLARFINLPPVESNKVAEIVKYEAKQQIPFALEEVEWAYQKISGNVDEDSGYMLNAEVGLFAMKKDQVKECLSPFLDADLDVELVQIAPLALHNFVCYDHMGVRVDEEPDEDDDEFTIVLDMGTDNTTLLITNGVKIWIRNVPVGGNHFTRALTKEMKLTFAKAEHLKCNATKSSDPRAVFQALRPVFNEYVAEIQRSIGYFSSTNREAKIVKVLGAGNGFKLAGLQKFLQQNLQFEVERAETFEGVIGDKVLTSGPFLDNVLTFTVPYGLALQVLGVTRIHTSLLPGEIVRAKIVRQKKPWAVIAASVILGGVALDMLPRGCVDHSVNDSSIVKAAADSDKFKTKFDGVVSQFGTKKTEWENEKVSQLELLEGTNNQYLVPEVLRAINECLPREVGSQKDVKQITQRKRIHVSYLVKKRYADLKAQWFDKIKNESVDGWSYMSETDKATEPTGSGYVFTLIGHHFHKGATQDEQLQFYVQKTLLSNLRQHRLGEFDVRRLGISHPTLVEVHREVIDYDPTGRNKKKAAGFKATGKRDTSKLIKVDKTSFRIEFIWKPTPQDVRQDPAEETAEATNSADGAAPMATAAPGNP